MKREKDYLIRILHDKTIIEEKLYPIMKTIFSLNILTEIEKKSDNDEYFKMLNISLDNIFDEVSYTENNAGIIWKSSSLKLTMLPIPNKDLITSYNIDITGFTNILYLHLLRSRLYLYMSSLNLGIKLDIDTYKDCLYLAYAIDALLGLNWGFYTNVLEKDWNFFKFWEIPQIDQAITDNNDNYPLGYYSFNKTKLFGLEKHSQLIQYVKDSIHLY